MDDQKRAAVLDDLAADASRKRDAFLDDAGRHFARFIDANKRHLKDLGGLVLIDDDPEYLSITEEGTFRSRTRFQDESGEWLSETEEIEDGADLVEIYNPADLYAAFADAALDEAELDAEEGAQDEEEEAEEAEVTAGAEIDVEESEDAEADIYDWLDKTTLAPRDREHAARLMYDLALTFQEGSQLEQARLLDDFQLVAAPVAEVLGDSKFVEDEDERLWLRASGGFEGEVVPDRGEDDDEEAEGELEVEWRPLTTPTDMVQFYDPTDLFGDLAEAIAETYPEVAAESDEYDDEAKGDDADSSGDESDET